MINFGPTFLLIFIDFEVHLGLHVSIKIAPKTGTELRGPPLFLIFQFFHLLGVPPGPDLVDFGSIFG